MINQLRVHNIDARTFYRWLRHSPEFRHRYEEAIAIRASLIPERFWELSLEVTDKNCRSRKTQARLLEKAIAHITGGLGRWRRS
jgi:terminase small subunit-like protein